MTNLSIGFKYAFYTAVFALALGVGGCKSGFNVDALPLDDRQVINYGTLVTENKAPVGAVVYGQLVPGSGERSKQVFDSEQKELAQSISKLRNLPKDYGFDAAVYNACIDGLQQKNSLMAPEINQARASANAAKNLAGVIALEVQTGGDLLTKVSDCEKNVPDSAKSAFDALAKELTGGYERLYQIALVLAQHIVQKEALEQLKKVSGALKALKDNLKNKVVIANEAQENTALSAVTVASNKERAAGTFIDGMTKKNKVARDFNDAVADLINALNRVNADYVNVADAAMKPEAKDLYDGAVAAANALNRIATDYSTGIEDLKGNKADPKLNGLVEKAFSGGISVVLGDYQLDNKTGTNQLTSLLSGNSVVVMKQDESSEFMVIALASAVTNRVAEKDLPGIDNVVGPKDSAIIEAKTAFGMSQEEFGEYATSRARKIREDRSKSDKYQNVYVIFADQLTGAGANVLDMISEFSSDGGKVLVVSADTSKYESKGKVFVAPELDLSAAVLTGIAILQEFQLPVSAHEISDKVVRIAGGLGSLTFADLAPLMKDAAIRISQLKNPSSAEVQSTIMTALAAHKVPTYLIETSGILDGDIKTVQANLATDRNFYVRAGGGRDVALQADIRRQQANERNLLTQQERDRKAAALADRDALLVKADDTIGRLGDAVNTLDVVGRSQDALNSFAIHFEDVKEHLNFINKIAEDRACHRTMPKLKIDAVAQPIQFIPAGAPGATLAPSIEAYFSSVSQNITWPPRQDKVKQVGPYVVKMLEAVNDGREISRVLLNSNDWATNELPYASLNCFASGNVYAKVKATGKEIKTSFLGLEGGLRRIATVANGNASFQQLVDTLGWVEKSQGSLGSWLNLKIQDFSLWDALNNPMFWPDVGGAYSTQARLAAPASDPFRRVNRRIYAYLFSMVVGKIKHGSIPWNADADLYQGFVDNDVMAKKIADDIGPMNLSERLVRTLILKEAATLIASYKKAIRTVYELPNDDREAFENNPTANGFLPFFNKIKTIVEDTTYLADFADFTKVQVNLRDEITTKLLPDEVMTMLNVYPSWHPHAYYRAATAELFARRWVGGMPDTVMQRRTDFDTAFPAGGQFAVPGAGDNFIKDRAAEEFTSLRALADTHAGGPHANAAAARAALVPPHDFYPPAFPAAAALKVKRFEAAGANAAVYLAAESEGVKKLGAKWPELLRIADDIYKSADKIYFYLTLVKKQ